MTKILTPMQRQYYEIKEQNPESILLFRLGDFYEMFDKDAIDASKILGITLTARNKGKDNEMKMCGIPHHSSEKYINQLTRAGKRVAICDQISDPSMPGIVERAVIKIITPGTIISETELDKKTSNYLLSIFEGKEGYGLSYSDISTGEFSATQIKNFEPLKNEIQRLNPSEILLEKDSSLIKECEVLCSNISFWQKPKNPQKALQDFFKIPNLKVFYIENEEDVINSASLLLDYILDTQKGSASQLTKITKYSLSDYMPVDISTLRNLEIFNTMYEGKYKGSLLSVIDKTITAGGGRKLKHWLLKPLKNIKDINERLDKVEAFSKNHSERAKLREILKETRDLERLLGKLASGKGNPKDLVAIRETLSLIPEIKNIVKQF